jgi:hypothetical protein
MQHCRRHGVWLLLCIGLSACSQIVDFDRSKLDPGDGGGGVPGGGVPGGGVPGGAGLDATQAPPADGALPDSGLEAGPPCTRDQECASDELCCEQECRKTSVASACSACNMGCSSVAASACSNRTCVCGAGAACAASTPYCLPTGSGNTSACAECHDSQDCQGRPDGKSQCVGGSCALCNPTDNAGCGGNTPICNPSSRACERCTANPDNCPGNLACVSSGACGGCASAATDCTSPTTPICDSATTQCRACAQGAPGDTECTSQLQKPYCEAGRCGSCRPGTDTGCDQASTKPDCRTNSAGQYECQRCGSNADCEHAPRSLCNTETGACAQCVSDVDCSDPTKPFCDVDGTCKGCSAVGGNALANIWCLASTLASRPVCDRNGGRCVRCTAAAGGCGDNEQCRVDGAASQNNRCVDCIDNSGCSGNNDRCNTATNSCIDCDANGGCSGTNNQCLIGNAPAMNACVDCVDNSGCTGQAPRTRCNTATRVCVECTQQSHCDDGDACTTDACMSNVCSHMPAMSTEDGFSCTDGTCNNGVITQVPVHSRCEQDSNLCTTERCLATAGTQPSGCGSEPVVCEAGTCDMATGICQ